MSCSGANSQCEIDSFRVDLQPTTSFARHPSLKDAKSERSEIARGGTKERCFGRKVVSGGFEPPSLPPEGNRIGRYPTRLDMFRRSPSSGSQRDSQRLAAVVNMYCGVGGPIAALPYPIQGGT